MALWQVEFMLLPKCKVEHVENIEEIGMESLWVEHGIKKCSIIDLEKVLQRTKSWSEDIVQLGDISGNVIEILYERTAIAEIICRLDLRNISNTIIETIISFINTNNLSIISKNKVYDAPNRESILEIIEKSDAYKFINNPYKFFDEMESKGVKK